MRRTALSAFVLGGLATVACVPDTASGPSPTSVKASASAAAGADAAAAFATATDAAATPDSGLVAAPATPVPDGPQKWKTVPREQNGFYGVLDGLCSQLAASRVGKDVVVHYGGSSGMYTNVRAGAASFVALRDDGLQSIGDPSIAWPTGVAGKSLDDFWIADSTGSRSSEGAVLHRYFEGKWKTYQKDQTNLHAWVDGGIIGSLGFGAANGDVWVEGSTTKPPASLHADLPFPSLAAFPSGDVLLVARKGELSEARKPLVARHWSPTSKVTEYPLEKLLPDGEGSARGDVHEFAPDEIYVSLGERVVRWDGAAFHALGKNGKTRDGESVLRVRRVASDDLWVVTTSGKLQRITKDDATSIAVPEPIADLDGVDRGGAWMVGKSGKIYKREGETWKPMPPPVPPFSAGGNVKAKSLVVLGADDVLVTALYWEKGPGWKEQELHSALFRTKPVKETLRCNEPDPENNNVNLGRGFQSWPPMATAECKTPFAVLARRSNANAQQDDWPRIRAALKGHPELGEVSLIDFASGDRTFVGAKSKDLETAKKIAALVAAKDRVRPEVVCGDPDPKRTLRLDLTTGAASPL